MKADEIRAKLLDDADYAEKIAASKLPGTTKPLYDVIGVLIRNCRAAADLLAGDERWQPIETHDGHSYGETVLVADADGYVVEAYYVDEYKTWWELNSADDGAPGSDRRVVPTHWMPLPAPPVVREPGADPVWPLRSATDTPYLLYTDAVAQLEAVRQELAELRATRTSPA